MRFLFLKTLGQNILFVTRDLLLVLFCFVCLLLFFHSLNKADVGDFLANL